MTILLLLPLFSPDFELLMAKMSLLSKRKKQKLAGADPDSRPRFQVRNLELPKMENLLCK